MKVVLLAGGFGTRISEETDTKPKPMVEIGGMPILWHIMKLYSHHGFSDFIVCAGYKSYYVKDFFYHYYMHSSDIRIDMATNKIEYLGPHAEPWRITIVDTGMNTMTGGRLKRVEGLLEGDAFMMTYGDGLSDVDMKALLEYHRRGGRLATLTAVQPSGKFGALMLDKDHRITTFQEKPHGDGGWVNGGFFVLEPGIFDFIKDGDETVWERGPLESLANAGQLQAYRHSGFWKPMDTLRDKLELEANWQKGYAPWKVWNE